MPSGGLTAPRSFFPFFFRYTLCSSSFFFFFFLFFAFLVLSFFCLFSTLPHLRHSILYLYYKNQLTTPELRLLHSLYPHPTKPTPPTSKSNFPRHISQTQSDPNSKPPTLSTPSPERHPSKEKEKKRNNYLYPTNSLTAPSAAISKVVT